MPPQPHASTADLGQRAAQIRSRTATVDAVFSPYVIALALYVPLLLLFLAVPADVFDRDFATTKHVSAGGIAFYGLAIALFVLGALAGDVMARRAEAPAPTIAPAVVARVRGTLAVALAVAIGAYAVWIGLAVWRADGVASFVELLRTDPDFVRRSLFATVPGVTTLTQLAVAAVPLAIAFRLLDRRLVGPLVVVVLVLALAVSMLASMRLLFLELAIPIGYLAVAGRRASPTRLVAVASLVVLAVAAFFVLGEIRRRGPYEPYGVVDAATRFLGYYLNSINNTFAVVENHTFAIPLYFSTQTFWDFPGVSHVARYEDVFHSDAGLLLDNFHRVNGLTRGVTTLGLPGETHLELGWAALLLILGLGAGAGALYRAGRREPLFRALYAVWLVGILEFTRIYYFLEQRMLPTYALFLVVFALLFRDRRSRVHAHGPSGR